MKLSSRDNYDTVENSTKLPGTPQNSTKLPGTPQNSTKLHKLPQNSTNFHKSTELHYSRLALFLPFLYRCL
jgi:hypothetical protein